MYPHHPKSGLCLSSAVTILLTTLCAVMFNGNAQASASGQPLDESLRFNPGYVSPIASQMNQLSVEAAAVAREALNGVPAEIPADWRLVNVIPKGNDYVMFFQSADGSVRSLRMQADGAISGQDVVWLRAYR